MEFVMLTSPHQAERCGYQLRCAIENLGNPVLEARDGRLPPPSSGGGSRACGRRVPSGTSTRGLAHACPKRQRAVGKIEGGRWPRLNGTTGARNAEVAMAERKTVALRRGTDGCRALAGVLLLTGAVVGAPPAPGVAQIPAVDTSAEVLAGFVEALLAGDEAAAGLYLPRQVEPSRQEDLRSELRNLMWAVGRREGVSLDVIYRVDRNLFVLLRSSEGHGYQFAVTVPPDTFQIAGVVYPSGWWDAASGPLVLGPMALGDGHPAGIRPDLKEIGDGLVMYVSSSGTELVAEHLRWRVEEDDFGRARPQLVAKPSEATLVLVGIPGITPGPAITLARAVPLAPGRPVARFELGDRQYEVELTFTDLELCDAVVILRSGPRSQELYTAREACDEPHFTIEWAGDLDGDGELDLAVVFSHKYSAFPLELYLSSAAIAGGMVGVVACDVRGC